MSDNRTYGLSNVVHVHPVKGEPVSDESQSVAHVIVVSFEDDSSASRAGSD